MAEKKKKKDLSMQQIMIYASLGISIVVALKLFLPKKENGNGRTVLSAEETQAYMQAMLAAQAQQASQLPQMPINPPQQIPLAPTNFNPANGHNPAISSNAEAMIQRAQLERIPIREEVGINNLFAQPTYQQMQPRQNTVNPYSNPYTNVQGSMHDFSRIRHIGEDGPISDVLASQKRQQVSPRQSPYLASVGYQSNPYGSGNVI